MLGKRKKSDAPKVVRRTKIRGSSIQSASLSQMASEKSKPHRQHPSLFLFTLHVIYKNLYILGITILRRLRRARRRASRVLTMVLGSFYSALDQLSTLLIDMRKEFVRRIKLPFTRIFNTYATQKPEIERSKAQGRFPLEPYLTIANSVWRLIWTVIRTLFNYLAPVAAAWVLIFTINLYVNQTLGLKVIYNGEPIGYIQSETEFERATMMLRDRFNDDNIYRAVVSAPNFVVVAVDDEAEAGTGQHFLLRLANRIMRIERAESGFTEKIEELADNMVRSSGNEIEHAYGLYVDNQFYGAVVDGNHVARQLENIRENNKTGALDEEVDFIKKIALNEGLYPVTSVIPIEDLEDIMFSYENLEQIYIVQPGDTPSGIADKIGVPYSLLQRLNPDMTTSLQIGSELITQVATPFLPVQNIHTMVYTEEYTAETEEILSNTYDRNYREIVQQGQNGIREVTAKVTKINGVETSLVTQETRVLTAAVPQKVIVGTNDPRRIPPAPPPPGSTNTPPTSSGFIWPTTGGYATTYRGHAGNGIDIARPHGTPIYASASGTVQRVNFSRTGYGNHVIIDHGNGYTTLYAHASSIHVSPGQSVRQGEEIARIGRTGNSSGNHVHFEIRQNGRGMYPVNYVGSRG